MTRIFIQIIFIFISFLPIHAQFKETSTPLSQIDSLSNLFDAAKNDTLKIKILLNAPKRIKEYIDNPEPILNLYNKAFKLTERVGDKKSNFNLLVEIAYLNMYALRDEPKAFKLFVQSLAYADKEKDYASCAQICFELAAINEHQNFRAKMYEYFLKSIAYNQKTPVLFIRPYRWASALYLEDNRIEDALNIARQAVGYVEERLAPAKYKALAYGYYYSVVKEIPNKKQEADLYRRKTVNFLRQIKTSFESDQLDDIATVCYEVQEYQLAIFFANQLLISKDSYSQRDASRIVCLEMISAAYEKLGRYKESLEFYKSYSKTYVNVIRSLLTLESGRKIIRGEGERSLLLKQKELDQERLYRNISFAIAAFIIILGAVIFFFYRREQNQKKELAQLNATKDRLFAILSHDLQSPIANLQTFMNLIQWGALDQTEFAESTDSFSSQLGNVRTMLENVLNWSISQMGGLKPKFEICNIHQIIEQELELLNLTAKSKEIKIINSINTGIEIRADKNHLAFIFRNLIQNAIKFSNIGGLIELNHTKENDKIKISVSDNGVGMSKETLNNLFKLDQTNSKTGTNAEKGTGLGLILTKDFVEANGGKMTIESQEGKGSVFTIEVCLIEKLKKI